MELICIKEKFKEYISLADKITSKNTTLPVLNSILLIAKDNILKIRSTNLDIGVEFNIPAKIQKNGIIAVPGSVLTNTLSCLPNDKKIYLKLINNNLELSTNNNTIIIKSQEAEDFPTLPRITSGENFKITSKKLVDGIKSVYYSSSFSDIKPEISSIFIYHENNALIFVATDSFRLAEKKINYKEIDKFSGVIIPIKNTKEIIRIFEGLDDDIDIIFNKNQISFSCNEIYLTSRIINGIFPDYKQIIPKEKQTEVIILKQDLIDSLKLVNVFSDKFNKVNIKVNIKDNIFELSSKNDTGGNNTKIKATLSGKDIELSFNYKYIIDCFQSITTDTIILQFNGENKPIIIKGINNNSFTYLIMPINK